MTAIRENDVVGLTRDLEEKLPEGTVGLVTQCNEDSLEVKFPFQGSEPVHTEVAPEDVKFLVGETQPEND